MAISISNPTPTHGNDAATVARTPISKRARKYLDAFIDASIRLDVAESRLEIATDPDAIHALEAARNQAAGMLVALKLVAPDTFAKLDELEPAFITWDENPDAWLKVWSALIDFDKSARK